MQRKINTGNVQTGCVAHLSFGDPSNNCSGKGVCKLSLAELGGPIPLGLIQINIVSSNDGIGQGQYIVSMALKLNNTALTDLKKVNPEAYVDVTTGDVYYPDQTALPFSIDSDIASKLWPGLPSLSASILPSTMPWALTQITEPDGTVSQVIITIDTVFLQSL